MSFLSGIFGGGKGRTTQAAAVAGLQLQSSTYGVPVQLVYGTTRIAPNLIWYGDFVATPQSSSGGSAGKGGVGGGGGGKGGGGGQSYVYQTAVMLGLCEGPILDVTKVYIDKNITSPAALGMSTALGTYPQAPWGYLTANHGAVPEAHTVPATGPYTVTVANASTFLADSGIVGPPAVSQYSFASGGSPAPGRYSISYSGKTQAFFEFNAADVGNTVIIQYTGPNNAIQSLKATIPALPGRINVTTGGYLQYHTVTATNVGYKAVVGSPAANQYSVSNGVYTFNAANAGAAVTITYASAGQSTPFQALGYNGIAHVDAAAYQLGNSAQLPNHNFEVQGILAGSASRLGSNNPDADASAVVIDLLSNPHHGASFPSGRIGDLTVYQSYCIASGLWISPAYNQQSQASSILDDIKTATNSDFVWSSGVLNLVPYGDQSITANGATYTAPSSPEYDLTDDDFVSAAGEDPVKLHRKLPADSMNSIKLECLDRANNYNPAVVEAKDQSLIDRFGLRAAPSKQSHLFCDLSAGRMSAQLQLQRQAIRNAYQFTLDQRYILLDPMDIVTITDSVLGLDRQWVRITEITGNDDGTLSVVAEEYLGGTGSAPLYNFQPGGGFNADYNSDPGDANPPVIFDAPVAIADTGLEVWMAASGGPNWGGCDVWISTDGNTYKNAGRITGGARQGVLSATLPPGSDPDTSHTLAVDLTQSAGQLLSGTQADADAFHTLCYVDGELISFQTATLTAQHKYNLTYLRRGVYGTTNSSHAGGSKFARLDSGIFTYPYDKGKIGQPLFIKLLSFNIYGGGQQSLADVPAYSHTIAGPPRPGTVQAFQSQQNGNVVAFNWIDLADESGLKGYDIAYAPKGETDWTKFILLTEAHRGTEMSNASVPPGTWTFAIRGHDIADNLGPMSTIDMLVVNANEVILSEPQQPLWPGTLVDAVVHYTGVLVPQSRLEFPQSTYSHVSPPGAPLLNAVPGGNLPGNTYSVRLTWLTGNNGTSSTAETTAGTTQTIFVFVDGYLLEVRPPVSRPANAAYYNVYASNSGFETLQNSAPIPIDQIWTMPATGLISGAAMPAINSTGWEVFDIFVPWPAYTSYTTPDYDSGFEADVRLWMSYAQALGPGQAKAPTLPQILLRADGVSQGEWTVGSVTGRYFQGEMIYVPASAIDPGNVTYFTDFTLTVDNVPQVENVGNVAIAPGGTVVTFPQRFHDEPYVQATVISNTALYATATDVTETDCVFHVWDSSGADVGGVINYTATGE